MSERSNVLPFPARAEDRATPAVTPAQAQSARCRLAERPHLRLVYLDSFGVAHRSTTASTVGAAFIGSLSEEQRRAYIHHTRAALAAVGLRLVSAELLSTVNFEADESFMPSEARRFLPGLSADGPHSLASHEA